MQAIRTGLSEGKSIAAVTADIQAFYHSVDPEFSRDPRFLDVLGVDLDEYERELHGAFIQSLVDWSRETPIATGLPVGLTASAVLANLLLFEFDKLIEREVVPLYYGRYADDVILVMENAPRFDQPRQVWDWLIARSDGALVRANRAEVSFVRPYLGDSRIVFANEKNRAFFLSGKEGVALASSIEMEICRRTSEWRSMPELPSQGEAIESNLLSAIQKDGEPAESLASADRISVRRAEFAIKLRNVEAFDRALRPDAWADRRHSFLDAFTRHVLVMPTFFDFFNYVERVVSLACRCADFKHLRQMIDALSGVLEDLEDVKLSVTGLRESNEIRESLIRLRFRREVRRRIGEAIEASFPVHLSSDEIKAFEHEFEADLDLIENRDLRSLQLGQRRLFMRDLAWRPLKQLVLPRALAGNAQLPVQQSRLARTRTAVSNEILPTEAVRGASELARMGKLSLKRGVPIGLLFPTRPPNMPDLYLLHDSAFNRDGVQAIGRVLLGLRGYSPVRSLPRQARPQGPIEITHRRPRKNRIRIALASWKTETESWVAAVTKSPDPDGGRLDRLSGIVGAALSSSRRPDYLVLPELSLPPHWFLAVASKLHNQGISLISGIEYLHGRRGSVHNQVWAALSHNALGFPEMVVYRQDKMRPAHHEESELWRVGGRFLRPKVPWAHPTVIGHGNFYFALLICSELTNIGYRASLRGRIDSLFVPEWNQDTTSFTSLVESSALDVHAYIVQCNDRRYGDSRIRAPMRDEWARDVVRVKGGIEDYLVIGEIDIDALRRFQSGFRSPDGPFKPVPDGFEISHQRKVLPQ